MNIQYNHSQEKQREKYTLVINYPCLSAGGIETGLVSMMRYFMSEDHRVVWITTTKHQKEVAFKGITDNPKLEIVISEKCNRYFGTPHIQFQENERVIMITCRAMQYVVGEEIKRRAKTREFKHYYVVAHFTGSEYYPDKYLKSKWAQKLVYNFWKKIVSRLVENDCLRGFSLHHLDSYETYYQIPISDKKKKLWPLFESEDASFDMKNALQRCKERNEKFVITTCSRFEFPHKGYILGLLDAYKTIKAKYPQAALRIIGFGDGEAEVREKVGQLPEKMRADVSLPGMVSPDELERYYKDSHVIVGLAGAVAVGAQSGIPALVVRHYCYACETYGYFDDAFKKTLSEDKGEDIVPFIEHCITMSQEEYLHHAESGYALISKGSKETANPTYFFEQYNAKDDLTVRHLWEAAVGRILYIIMELKNRIEG